MKIEIPFPHQEVAQTRTLPGRLFADPEVFGGREAGHLPQEVALCLSRIGIWFLFPNIIFSIFPGTKNFSVSWVDPVSAVSSLRKFVTRTPDGISKEREAARSRWGLEVLNEEDRQLCRSVQKGMVQRGFDMGYYLVDPRGNLSEDTVRHFHRIYLKWMFPVVSKV
jgi:hypothetical protein